MRKPLVCLLAAAALLAPAPAAQAADIAFLITEGVFGTPSMHFEQTGGQFTWDRKPIITAYSASGTAASGEIWMEALQLKPQERGGHDISLRLPADGKWSHAGALILSRDFLAPSAAVLAERCRHRAGPLEASLTFTALRAYRKAGGAGLAEAKVTVTMPVSLTCGDPPAALPAATVVIGSRRDPGHRA